MDKRKITLEDISADTKLSTFSVSRAIAGKEGVSEETRKKVLESCERLGYKRSKPQHAGKRYILFIIPKYDAQDTSFWMKVMMGVENSLAQIGYALHLKATTDVHDSLSDQEVEEAAGILFAGYKSLSYIDKIAVYHKPMLILTYPPHNLFPYDAMHLADREGAYCLCEKMINMGHSTIGYYGSLERPSMKKRFEGVVEATGKYSATITNVWDNESYCSSDEFINELKDLQAKNKMPSLIICCTDTHAQALILILNRIGLKIPKDISVTGFNSDLDESQPIPLTSVGFNKREYGHLAVHYLMNRIKNPNLPPTRISIVPQIVMGATVRAIH